MNTSAAKKLSALMNQYDVIRCVELEEDDYLCLNKRKEAYPNMFQRIIESGIREAVANNQDDIQPKLSHFYIKESNIRDLHNIWSTNTFNVQVLHVQIDKSDFLNSTSREKPASYFEFNLSSCHNLRKLNLTGDGIWLRGKNTNIYTFLISVYENSELEFSNDHK
ncbi:hypothetical protein DPMN_162553 [Dreissena polymorpha]|uniref:Uncharacterized protein n=1 Tax=Dreissena polymorpha TaxID=45954 RepID=A0A9D4IUF6_DREPO|nr:hypothetical protein DPMN_162553 [Dreissena polymorpha]